MTSHNVPPPAGNSSHNYANPHSSVGIQAQIVKDSNVYVIAPDSPPEEKYQTGVRYLEGGIPSKAREMINVAVEQGHDGAEVRFYQVLAMLSKRSYRELSKEDNDRLDAIAKELDKFHGTQYTPALEAFRDLLIHRHSKNGLSESAEEKILEMDYHLRSLIHRHLGLVLTGATKERLWKDTVEQAKTDQKIENREARIWAYFHPEPIPARKPEVEIEKTTDKDEFRAMALTWLFSLASAYLCWILISNVAIVPLLVAIAALPAGYYGILDSFNWRYILQRIGAKDQIYLQRFYGSPRQGSGFTSGVERSFHRYFSKYHPSEIDKDRWMNLTSGIRAYLIQEISRSYREQRVPVRRVDWLIGFLAQDIRRQWRSKSLLSYRERYQLDSFTTFRCVISITILSAAFANTIIAAIMLSPLTGILASIIALVCGKHSLSYWYRIISEARRYGDDTEEAENEYVKRTQAYEKWRTKLHKTKPSEKLMETWLRHDKTILIDEILQHYRLSWKDIISHAVFQIPKPRSQRNRVRNGPWRYSRYELKLFLMTHDGVREASTDLEFERAEFRGQERTNFRYDALSSVNVVEESGQGRILELTLTNGPTRRIKTSQPVDNETTAAVGLGMTPYHNPDFEKSEEMTLDSFGFDHALGLLEGIAAEGKKWVERNHANSSAPSYPA